MPEQLTDRADGHAVRVQRGGDAGAQHVRRVTGPRLARAAHATELLQHSDPKVTRRHYRAKVVPVKPTR